VVCWQEVYIKLGDQISEKELQLIIDGLSALDDEDNIIAIRSLTEKIRSMLFVVQGMGKYKHQCWLACRPDY